MLSKAGARGTFLGVQWLRLCTSPTGDTGLIPCWGTKTLSNKKKTNTKVGAIDAGGITHCCDACCWFGPLQVRGADWDYSEFFQSFGHAGVKNKSSQYFGCSSSSAFLKGCVALACEKGTQKSPRKALRCAQMMPTPSIPSYSLKHVSGCVQAKFLKLQSQTPMSPPIRHKRGCRGAGSFGPGPCCPPTSQGRSAAVSH